MPPTFRLFVLRAIETGLAPATIPALIRFAARFRQWVSSKRSLDLRHIQHAQVDLSPNRVARAVVGHLLAAEERRDPVAPLVDRGIDLEMRQYFLDESSGAPPFRIYVWPYAASDIVIMREFGASKLGVRGAVVGSIFKLFPFAFWVAAHDDSVAVSIAELPLT